MCGKKILAVIIKIKLKQETKATVKVKMVKKLCA